MAAPANRPSRQSRMGSTTRKARGTNITGMRLMKDPMGTIWIICISSETRASRDDPVDLF